ncbi:MAG: cysteine desulfurase family protein [Phycisphaerae bacterium]
MELVYLDNNATTRPDPQVVQAMSLYLSQYWGNPSSAHRFGQRCRQGIDEARAQLAALLSVRDSELTFTGSGTEATNTALRGLLAGRAPRTKIITTAVEHSATREMCQQLAKEGAEVVLLPVSPEGDLDPAAVAEALSDDVAFVSTLWANNETGVLFDVAEIARICRDKGVPYHVDATQAVGKIPVDLSALGVDAATIAAHKFHGPKGIGALYVRRGLRIRPWLIGGPQERGKRGGTENVAGIVGMGKAAELALAHLPQMQRVAEQRDRFEEEVTELIPDTMVIGNRSNRLPNTASIGFAHLEAEAILMLLSEQGICASAGAACSSGSLEPSHVLKAMAVPEVFAHGAIRFSLGRFTTDSELDIAVATLPGVIERLRSVLPVG